MMQTVTELIYCRYQECSGAGTEDGVPLLFLVSERALPAPLL